MLRRATVIVAVALLLLPFTAARAQTEPRPNFVFILTDDQPIGTVEGMPNVSAMMDTGVRFDSGIISNPLCCPSRATILTGLYSHSNGVYTNGDSGDSLTGGYAAFTANGDQERAFAPALHDAGYQTGLFGKYLNRYDGSPQPGWDAFHSFVGTNGSYYDYQWTIDWQPPVSHGSDPADYSTDVAGSEATTWLTSLDPARPFLLYFAPYGPHEPATPAPQDVGATTSTSFSTPAYNEADVHDKPRWVQERPLYGSNALAAFNTRWNLQYASLLSVDRWVGVLSDTLEQQGRLADTYFIFLSDNGFTWGDHRFNYKAAPYDRSIRVPFMIAGPGVVQRRVRQVASNVDLAPTILDLAGVAPIPTDGMSVAGVLAGGSIERSGVLLEHMFYKSKNPVPDYCGFRNVRFMFARYDYGDGTQEEELYNLRRDPYELRNIATVNTTKAAQLRHAAYAAGCDLAMVPPPTG